MDKQCCFKRLFEHRQTSHDQNQHQNDKAIESNFDFILGTVHFILNDLA